jgi:hypothetical protein
MRQPHEANASAGSAAESGRKTAAAMICPAWVPLQGEARVVTAASERGVLDDHGAGPAQLTGHREALHEPQQHQQERSQQPDLGVGGQQRYRERRHAHQQHGQDQHVLAAVPVVPVPEDERADRPGDVADGVGRQRRDQRDGRVALREEHLGEDQRRGLGVDEEVVVLERAADPAARDSLPGRWAGSRGPVRLVVHDVLLACG